MAKIKVTQVKSTIKRPKNQKRILESLGLHRIGQSAVHEDNPGTNGMITKVNHLITIEKVS